MFEVINKTVDCPISTIEYADSGAVLRVNYENKADFLAKVAERFDVSTDTLTVPEAIQLLVSVNVKLIVGPRSQFPEL